MKNHVGLKAILLFLILLVSFQLSADNVCTYKTYSWNTLLKKVTNFHRVQKNYIELSEHEVDRFTGCSVCEQDQRTIKIPGIKPFKVCHILAPQIRHGLMELIDQGQLINSVVGYRVGMTRGNIDEKGLRTKFSNHSFGIAIDINSAQNGLYGNCFSFNDKCVLIRGGEWNPEREGSLTAGSIIVKTLQGLSLKWGGQISGRQKDFMHFSPTGY